ncbi:MAG: hypothetical protein ACRBN8_41070 [Nannocystales bacterium]
MAAPTKSAKVLPLSRLRLYETGVGYFERRGRVNKNDRLALPVPTAHLDDALKTLVVLDGGTGARVGGIAFSTAVSEGMARAMAGLPDESDGVGYSDLLHSLEGTRVIVSAAGGKVTGRLIDVEGPFGERAPREGEAPPKGPPPAPEYNLLVLGNDGSLRRLSTKDISGVQPAESAAADRLDVAAEALSDHTARTTQKLGVRVEAGGKLGLGYVAESPVWRTSYRVVLGTGDKRGALQGWALVHNDTDEDWKNVDIELVNGRPASFLFPLAAPRYARRELIEPQEQLSTVPQLAKTTPDRMWLDGELGESFGIGGLGMVGTGRGGGGSSEGTIALGNVGITGKGGGFGSVGIGDLAELTQANTEAQGALFVYGVSDPVDLQAHHSALLPIVSEDIEAESITWFSRGEHDGLTSVRLVNTTKQTLPGGTVSFFSAGGFVGETMLSRLGPGERRFVVYGAELDVELSRNTTAVGESTKDVRYTGEELRELYVARSDVHLNVDNRSRRSQRVYVGLDISRNSKLSALDQDIELDYDLQSGTPLVAMTVPAGEAGVHVVRSETAGSRTHAVNAASLDALSKREGVPSADRKILLDALAFHQTADRHRAAAEQAKQKLDDATADLLRIREDLTALGDAGVRGRLRDKLSRQILEKETAIVELRTQRRASFRAMRTASRQAGEALQGLETQQSATEP